MGFLNYLADKMVGDDDIRNDTSDPFKDTDITDDERVLVATGKIAPNKSALIAYRKSKNGNNVKKNTPTVKPKKVKNNGLGFNNEDHLMKLYDELSERNKKASNGLKGLLGI